MPSKFSVASISSASSSYTGCSQEAGFSYGVTYKNQISTFCYDAAGNLLLQATCPTSPPYNYTYAYDAENHLSSTNGYTYLYDGDGRRVEKQTGNPLVPYKLYYYGEDGQVWAETNGSGTVTDEYVYFDGSRIAHRDSGLLYLYANDDLGSARAVIQSGSSSLTYDADFYPFGGERAYTVTCSPNYKFSGKERDSESGLDDSGARFYSSALGRFSSPDPVVMTRLISDPQSLNKYSYAFNRPSVLVDLDGAWPAWYHHVIINDTFGNLGPHAVHVLEDASDWVDSVWAGNQAPANAFMHAMRNGATHPEQSVEEAEQQTNAYIDTQLQAAVDEQIAYEAGGGIGNSDEALTNFGHALHTVTDRASPEHAGYQPWYCLLCPSAVHHERAEENSSTSSNSADEEARHLAHVAAAQLWTRYQAQLKAARKKNRQQKPPKKISLPMIRRAKVSLRKSRAPTK